MRTIKLSKKDLETIGGNSLEGRLVDLQIMPPCTLRILFEQTTSAEKRANGGPDEILIPEHVPMCLCESIASLATMGFGIRIGEYTSE